MGIAKYNSTLLLTDLITVAVRKKGVGMSSGPLIFD